MELLGVPGSELHCSALAHCCASSIIVCSEKFICAGNAPGGSCSCSCKWEAKTQRHRPQYGMQHPEVLCRGSDTRVVASATQQGTSRSAWQPQHQSPSSLSGSLGHGNQEHHCGRAIAKQL
jgi:hypothetical protein